MLIRLFLTATAIMFLLFGTVSLLDPEGMATSFDVVFGGPNGTFEARGIYGGVSLGFGLLAAAGVFMDRYVRPALWAIFIYMSGYVFARGAAIVLEGLPTERFYAYIAFEAIMAGLSGVALIARKGN